MANKLNTRLNTVKGFSQLRFEKTGMVQGYNNLYFQGANMEEINKAKISIFNMYTKRQYYLTNICVGIIYTFQLLHCLY